MEGAAVSRRGGVWLFGGGSVGHAPRTRDGLTAHATRGTLPA